MERICRTCLKVSENLFHLFDDTELPHKIQVIASIQVSISDNLPSKICDQCVRNIHLFYEFRSIIIRNDIILKKQHSCILKNEENCADSSPANMKFFAFEIKSEDLYLEEETSSKIHLDTDQSDSLKEVNTESIGKHSRLHLPMTESHIESTHLETKNYDVANDVIRIRKYTCKLCNFSCSEYAKWKNHKRIHVVCPKSVCSTCGKTVRTDNLKKHIVTHTESPVTCKDCGKTCKNTESLRGHAIIHRGIKLQCNTCGKVYKHRGGYTAHIKRHALGDVKTIACTICGKLFYEKKVLEKHIRSHTGERPYPCEYCKKGFSSSNALKTHIRQHTNERPYACELCLMAFSQKVSLRTHLKSKHSEVAVLNTL